ncbi:trypco2 family protein [Streptomyces sp. NPDC059076]|uniref:trypco2 family protein n=1 Tax=unclassified Streptomyces TaxID=2593676 RepID=UPI0036D0FA30
MSDTHANGTAIELADAIEAVREQLVDAAGRATGQPVLFEVGDIEMEFTIELRKDRSGGLKAKAWVLEAGGDTTRSTGHTHRVSFTLTPKNARTGGSWLVGHDEAGDTADFGTAGPANRP